jgi:hypothetical protein
MEVFNLAIASDKLSKKGKKIGNSLRHVIEYFELDLRHSVEAYVAYEKGDMITWLKWLPINLITLGAYGHEKMCIHVMNSMETLLRVQEEMPQVGQCIGASNTQVNGFYVEALHSVLANGIRNRKIEAHADDEKVQDESVLNQELSTLRILYRSMMGKKEISTNSTEFANRVKDCYGAEREEERGRVRDVSMDLLREVLAGNIDFEWHDRSVGAIRTHKLHPSH